MISVLVLLTVLALLIGMAYAGYRDGLYGATYALMRGLIGFVCAMTFCGPVGHLLSGLISQSPAAQQYLRAIAFAGIFGLVLAAGAALKIAYTDPGIGCPAMVDRVAGPAVGILGAVVFTGALLIFWSLLPFPKFIPADQGRINAKLGALDTGAAMLKFYSFLQARMGGNAVFLLQDEPLISDANKDGRADPGDEFSDLNRNGTWDRGWLWRYYHYADIGLDVLPAAAPASPPAPAAGGSP